MLILHIVFLETLFLSIVGSRPILERPRNLTAEVLKGLGDAAKGSVIALKNLVVHPLNSTKGAIYLVRHPVKVVKHIKNETTKGFRDNPARSIGKTLFYILSVVLPLGDIIGTAADFARIVIKLDTFISKPKFNFCMERRMLPI